MFHEFIHAFGFLYDFIRALFAVAVAFINDYLGVFIIYLIASYLIIGISRSESDCDDGDDVDLDRYRFPQYRWWY
jgi:hypothetical protein